MSVSRPPVDLNSEGQAEWQVAGMLGCIICRQVLSPRNILNYSIEAWTPLVALEQGLLSGCSQCAFLLSGIKATCPDRDESLSCWIFGRRLGSSDYSWLRIGMHYSEQDLNCGGLRDWYDFYPVQNMPADQLYSLPAIPSTTWDETIVKWVNQCRIHHNHPCNTIIASEALPTRILELDLGDKSLDVRLISGDNVQADSYNILSYCWGPAQPLVTTTLNLQSHLERIPWGSLPILFQEAIHLMRKAGIRGLWIDALCIIQDDQEDWERESQNMSSYYGNACLTISADASHNPAKSSLPCRPRIYLMNNVPTLESVHVQKIPVHFNLRATRFNMKNPNCMPLHSRAWAYQERLLSRRILHLGREEAVWECRQSSWCECGQRPDLWHGLPDTKFDPFVVSHFSALFNRDGICEYWQTLLEMYMSRAITYETDKLRAVQGLATQISRFWASYTSTDTRIRLQNVYMLGLWSADIPRSLLWANISEEGARNRVFPSWSWASISGIWRYQRPPKEKNFTSTAKVIRLPSQMWDFNRQTGEGIHKPCFGLSAKAVSAMLSSSPRESKSAAAGVDGWLFQGLKRDPTMLFDIDVREVGAYDLPLPVSCSYIGFTEEWNMRRYWAIVLRKSNDTSGAFERVGVVSACYDWYERAQIQEVTLV